MRRTMKRREFLARAAATAPAAAALWGGLGAIGCGDASPGGVAPPGAPAAAWLPDSLTTIGSAELDVPLTLLAGRLPADLQGHHFLQTSLPFDDDSSLLNGVAMLFRLDLSPDGVALRSRILRTDDWYVDQAAAGTAWAFRNYGITRFGGLGVRNYANTGLLPMGDRLLATYDAGRPWIVDPVTLEAVTPVGLQREWRASVLASQLFPAVFTSAHPVYDPTDGLMYCPNYGASSFGFTPFVELAIWDGAGDVRRVQILAPDGSPLGVRNGMHQIAVTRAHVVLNDTSFVSSLDPLDPATSAQPSDFWVVRKADLGGATARAVHFRIPREAIHFLVDHDDDGDRITLHVSHTSAQSTSWINLDDVVWGTGERVSPNHRRKGISAADIGLFGRYVLDVGSGTIGDGVAVADDPLTHGLGLYSTGTGDFHVSHHRTQYWATSGFAPDLLVRRVMGAYADYPNRTIPLADMPRDPVPSALLRFDFESMRVRDAYVLPAGYLCLSPQLAPARGRSGDGEGWVVASVISDQLSGGSSGDEFWIFDGRDLARGPVARLGHSALDLPFTIHTAWLPSLASPGRSYWVDPNEDYGAAIAALPADARAIGETALARARS